MQENVVLYHSLPSLLGLEDPVKVLPWQLSTVELNGIAAVMIDLTF